MEFISKNELETLEFATNFAKNLKGGECLILNGDLGAGKTTFTKGLALGLGIFEDVTSPTFTIMNDYAGLHLNLYHFDMYRIENFEELLELGILEILKPVAKNCVCVIEWASNVPQIIPSKNITINIEKIDENKRRFVLIDNMEK